MSLFPSTRKSLLKINNLNLSALTIIVFIIAILCRVGFLFIGRHELHIIDSYDIIADNIIHGIGFSYNGIDPTVCRAPVYPVYLAVLKAFTNSNNFYFIARICDLIIDSCTAGLIVLSMSTWFNNYHKKTWFLAGFLYAVNPFAIYYTIKLGPETLATFVFIIFIYTIGRIRNSRFSINKLFYFSLISGLLMLNKSVFLPCMLIAPFIIYKQFKNNKNIILKAIAFYSIIIIILAPWIWRNYTVSNSFVPVQTLTGFNFWYDFTFDENRNKAIASGDINRTYTGTEFTFAGTTQIVPHPYSLSAKADVENEKRMIADMKHWIIRNPTAFLKKILDNILAFWYAVETPKKMIIAGAYSLSLIFLSLLGIYRAKKYRNHREIYPLLALLGIICITYSPVFAVFRYSLIVTPILIMLSSLAFFNSKLTYK